MGLFSFFKKAGSKLKVEKPEEKSMAKELAEKAIKNAKISAFKAIVTSLELPIDDLDINLDDDVVIVSGTTDSHENREKIILALGNVDGIAGVDDRIIVDAPDEPESQFHTVERGDSLSKIAKKFYGDPMKYPVIFEANKPMLSHPDKIYPGQNLRIPAIVA